MARNRGIGRIWLHVQVGNDVALKFYEGFGFKNTGTVENYYKRVKPADAYILEKDFSLSTSE